MFAAEWKTVLNVQNAPLYFQSCSLFVHIQMFPPLEIKLFPSDECALDVIIRSLSITNIAPVVTQ